MPNWFSPGLNPCRANVSKLFFLFFHLHTLMVYFRWLLPFLIATSLLSSAALAAPVLWQRVTEIARGPGEKGLWQQNESRYNYVDDPTVLIDTNRTAVVAWVNQTIKDVLFQRYAPDGQAQLQEPVNVSRNPQTFSWLPRMERAPDDPQRLYVLWQEIIFSGGSHGGDILFARSDDGGNSFSQPLNLSRSIGGDGKGRINAEIWHNGSLDIVAGPNGTVYAAWTEYEGPLWFSRSLDGGKTFSTPAIVTGGKGSLPARAPALALDKNGKIYLAWTHGETQGANIHLAHSSDGGVSFSEPSVIAPSSGYADAPKIAVDPDGALHLTYAQSDAGPFASYQINYTRSDDGGRSFVPARAISTPLPASVESARFPFLGLDAASRVYVTYELYPQAGGGSQGLGISVSTDNGRSFSAPEPVPNSASPIGGINGSQQGKLMDKLAVSRHGDIAIANSSLKQDVQSRVWLMRGEFAQQQTRR